MRPPATNSRRDRRPAKLLPAGDTFVKIFGRDPGPYTIQWRALHGRRRRTTRATWKAAHTLAQHHAARAANTHTAIRQLTPLDAAGYLRALENLHPTGQSIEHATAEHAHRQQRLQALGISFDALVDWYEQNRPRRFRPLHIPELVAAFTAQKAGTISPDYQTHLERQLQKFAAAFTVPLHTLTAADLRAWIARLTDRHGRPLGPRARHHYRAALAQLARFARAENHLPRTWDELEHVPTAKTKPAEIKILAPEQLLRLLTARQHAETHGHAHKTLIPFLALQSFAGLRHAETLKLDWRDIHLDERYLYVSKGIAKTGRDRIVPIAENLTAWLAPHLRRHGPVTPITASHALTHAKRAAGLPAARDETRNILRKSYISYRLALTKSIAQVAEEAGNSPAIIRQHYGRPIPEAEAQRWFSILPSAPEVLQLNFTRP